MSETGYDDRKDRKAGWARLRHRVEIERFPQRVELKPRGWGTYVGLAFGLALILVTFPDQSSFAAGLGGDAVVDLILPAVGLFFCLRGVMALATRRTALFTADGVEVTGRSPFGREAWQLPYSAYRGVLHRERVVRRKRGSTMTIQIVELLHDARGMTLPLLIEASSTRPRQAWEAYARGFGLPALTLVDGELETRAPEDLDKSIRQLATEGKVAPDLEGAVAKPPEGLEVEREIEGGEDRLRITLTAARFRLWRFLLVGAVPALFLVIGAAHSETMAVFGGILVAAMVAIFAFDRLSEREIIISRTHLVVRDMLQNRPRAQMSFALEEIENIAIRHGRKNVGKEVLIEGDRTQVRVGAGLSQEALDWLKNFLTALIATA